MSLHLNLLMIGLDPTLAMGREHQVHGDTLERHLRYARRVHQLHAIVKTDRATRLPRQQIEDRLFIYPTNSLTRYHFLRDAYRIGNAICAENTIHLITTQDPWGCGLIGFLLSRRWKISLNLQVHNEFLDNQFWIRERIENRVLRLLGKWLLKRADTIRWVGSQSGLQAMCTLGISPASIYSIPAPVSPSRFLSSNGSALRKELLGDRFEKIVLSVGRLTPQKDFPTLIRTIPEVIHQNPKVLFIIIGSGPEEERLKTLAQQIGINSNLLFQGGLPIDEIPTYLHACDLFLCTSVYEGFGRVLLEAGLCGKAVVTTDVGIARELINDGETGFIVERRDHTTLVQKMLYLVQHPELALQMGAKMRSHILARFDEEQLEEQMIEMWLHTAAAR